MPRNDELAKKLFENGEQITASITIQRPASEIYQAWAGFRDLPKFVEGLRSVGARDGGGLEMKAAPWEGEDEFAWDAEILKEEPGRMVAWRSAGTQPIPNAGSVTLRELPFSRGTEVTVVVDYIPPQGALGQKWDKAMGKDPKKFLQLSLFRLRQLLEAGEVATTKGQPAGRGDGRDEQGSGDEQKFAKAEGHS